jgi:hypothetical protein
MAKKKPQLIMFRVRPDVPSDQALARRLRKAAKVTGTPVSQFLRESAERSLKELAKRYPEIEAA